MIRMNGNCNKELILLILFVTTSYSLIPFLDSRCGQDWENGEFPSFVPESKQARREYCDLHERMELSRNQLDHQLEEWAAKYGVLDQFNAALYLNRSYESMYRDIFKNNIDYFVWSKPKIREIFFEIFNLLGDRDIAIGTMNKKINELLDRLPAEKATPFLESWSQLDNEAMMMSKMILLKLLTNMGP